MEQYGGASPPPSSPPRDTSTMTSEQLLAHGDAVLAASRESLARTMTVIDNTRAIGLSSDKKSASLASSNPSSLSSNVSVADDYRRLIESQRSDGSWSLDVLLSPPRTIQATQTEFNHYLLAWLANINVDGIELKVHITSIDTLFSLLSTLSEVKTMV
jgi:hypothetical protein